MASQPGNAGPNGGAGRARRRRRPVAPPSQVGAAQASESLVDEATRYADTPDAVRALIADNLRQAAEATRAVPLEGHVEPAFVFRP